MELGPIQKQWVENLKKYPERQGKTFLAQFDEQHQKYQGCCLGEYLMVYYTYNNTSLPVNIINNENKLHDGVENQTCTLQSSYEILGLYSPMGRFQLNEDPVAIHVDECEFESLADMNDTGTPWPKIAQTIEKNPDLIFYKSV